MDNQKRRFRPRPQKSNFRRRSNGHGSNNSGHFQSNNGNSNFGGNGSMTNPHNVEKAIQKYQQLAKDAQSLGDPVLVENYLQHADHFARKLSELNFKNESSIVKKTETSPTNISSDTKTDEIKNNKNI
tara:strand:+ start:193 stop:576 length:384 start_codon:yes stop_codon:yes gene_type:complete